MRMRDLVWFAARWKPVSLKWNTPVFVWRMAKSRSKVDEGPRPGLNPRGCGQRFGASIVATVADRVANAGLTLLICLACGCASLTYEHKDYGRVEYRRWWSQEVGAVSIEIDGKPPIRLHMQRQKAEMPEVDKIAGAIASGLVP